MVDVPQPSPSRLTPVSGSPVVVGVVPDQPSLVALTAASLVTATGRGRLCFGYADPARYAVEELPDGTVRHASLDPDGVDDSWKATQSRIRRQLEETLRDVDVTWDLYYLAGRPDRALTHLARAVDAATIVVGTREPGAEARVRELLEGSVAAHLGHHQHRPVLVVPLSVVDWKVSAPWD